MAADAAIQSSSKARKDRKMKRRVEEEPTQTTTKDEESQPKASKRAGGSKRKAAEDTTIEPVAQAQAEDAPVKKSKKAKTSAAGEDESSVPSKLEEKVKKAKKGGNAAKMEVEEKAQDVVHEEAEKRLPKAEVKAKARGKAGKAKKGKDMATELEPTVLQPVVEVVADAELTSKKKKKAKQDTAEEDATVPEKIDEAPTKRSKKSKVAPPPEPLFSPTTPKAGVTTKSPAKASKPSSEPKKKSKAKARAPTPPPEPSSSEKEDDNMAADGNLDDEDEDDHLHGFSTDDDDSSDEEDAMDVEPSALDISKLPTIAKDDATVKRKLDKAKRQPTEDRGVLYLGRLPHGFYEDQLKAYFSQFGTVTRLRLSRNKKTGQSKHFAFLEFDSSSVAQIVADTMDNYLLMGHILRCKVIPKDEIHPELWVGSNRKYRVVPKERIARVEHNKPRTEEEQERASKRLMKRQNERKRKLEEAGIKYDFEAVSYKKPKEVDV